MEGLKGRPLAFACTPLCEKMATFHFEYAGIQLHAFVCAENFKALLDKLESPALQDFRPAVHTGGKHINTYQVWFTKIMDSYRP